ncbi:DNA-processing protein DprA [Patescibacteria group bacterium]|nr:DNA-processing protein DprA [Patescibacteria group bacterium]
MEEEEKKYWIAFSVFEGIGPLRFKLLLSYFGTAQKAFKASAKELRVIGLPEKITENFLKFRENFNFDSYFIRIEENAVKTIFCEEENYPNLLKEIDSMPPVLYVKLSGNTVLEEVFNKKSIAIVGSRKMTPYGEKVTKTITKELVLKDWCIVSGLARGVDRIAHEAAIENKGTTIAVVGSGLDCVYPPEHKTLADKIIKNGGLIFSEFPFGAKITAGNFPARNRIISGLSLGVVVTEAALDSGSLITASYAAEQGREVFAVPGPINSSLSEGTASLIKKGAKLVTRVEDILEELG